MERELLFALRPARRGGARGTARLEKNVLRVRLDNMPAGALEAHLICPGMRLVGAKLGEGLTARVIAGDARGLIITDGHGALSWGGNGLSTRDLEAAATKLRLSMRETPAKEAPPVKETSPVKEMPPARDNRDNPRAENAMPQSEAARQIMEMAGRLFFPVYPGDAATCGGPEGASGGGGNEAPNTAGAERPEMRQCCCPRCRRPSCRGRRTTCCSQCPGETTSDAKNNGSA